ncbi:site-specific integrase [Streptomyces sp. NPDC006654]|uniref:tyrosine-type recombinase/integrase n=1 Tax=Streptomyces sp. NPDC006654 TaxID=3156897 RepID=UPI0033E5D54D
MEPVRRYLIDFVARYNRPGSVRSYAFDLLRWWRWLRVVDVPWNQATPAEGRDFALWLGATVKVPSAARTVSTATAGTINPITKKPYLDDRYKPRTIRHSNAVIRSFYTFWIETGEGPLINPVPLARSERRRPHAHHNPLDPYRGEGRLRYNPKVPRRRPRQMSDERWNELFTALRSNRDRAIVALAISNGARASELLGMKGVDVDWGDQLVRVVRKGAQAEQWLPASAEAFIWVRLYQSEGTPLDPQAPLWWTLRRRDHGTGLIH